jgi:hypothetical protein
MTTKSTVLRLLFPLGVLSYPFVVCYPLLKFWQSAMLYQLGAIVPQYIIWPYLAYYDLAGRQLLQPCTVLVCLAHWLLVIGGYWFATRDTSLKLASLVFFGFWLGSMGIAHVGLRLSGYTFVLDSI